MENVRNLESLGRGPTHSLEQEHGKETTQMTAPWLGEDFIVDKKERTSRGIWRNLEQRRKRNRLNVTRTILKRRGPTEVEQGVCGEG